MKKIAIIGAGFAGLAAAWHLSQKTSSQITLFDPNPIGTSTSGISAGLLHPYAGAHSKLNRFGYEGYQNTLELLNLVSTEFGSSVYEKSGILRIAVDPMQEKDFFEASQKFPDIGWLTPEECIERAPGIVKKPGILISSGCLVHSEKYLQGLWRLCRRRNVEWNQAEFTKKNNFDVVIFAGGTNIENFAELKKFRLKVIKGQLLKLSWPEEIPPLKTPLNSYVYMFMDPDGKSCTIGSTYEKEFFSNEPDSDIAQKLLFPKLEQLYPALLSSQIYDCKSGLRGVLPGHLPFAGHVEGNLWAIFGMGSKGLLYHNLYAKNLTQNILAANL